MKMTDTMALAWTPATLGASLSLWFDADDTSTITLDGSTVNQWRDKSGATSAHEANTIASSPCPRCSSIVLVADGPGMWQCGQCGLAS